MKGKLEKLIRLLREGNSLQKERAKEGLSNLKGKKAVKKVLVLLKEKDIGLKMHAHEILKKIGKKDIEAIGGLLKDPEEELRIFACEILGETKKGKAKTFLIEALKDESINVRNAAASALANFKGEEVIRALLQLLKDEPWVSFSAITSLAKIRDKRAIPYLFDLLAKKDQILSKCALEALLEFDDEDTFKKILEFIKGLSQEERGLFLDVLLERQEDQIFELLKEKMGEDLFFYLLLRSKQMVKKDLNLLKRLSRFKKKEVVEEILYAFLEIEPDTEEYEETLEILCHVHEVLRTHIEEFLPVLREESVVPIVKVFAKKGMRLEEGIIERLFDISNPQGKREIIKALPLILEGEKREIIKRALKDEDGHVRREAVSLIGLLHLHEFKEELLRIAKKDFFDVRVSALGSLIQISKEEAIGLIKDLVEKGSLEDKKLYLALAEKLDADTNLPFIKRLLKDSGEIKKEVFKVLSDFLSDERYLELIKEEVKKDVTPELIKLIKEKRLEFFSERLKEVFSKSEKDIWLRYYAFLTLISLCDRDSLELLKEGLKDPSPLIKIASLKAILELKEKTLKEHIKPLLEDKEKSVRTYAKEVLKELT